MIEITDNAKAYFKNGVEAVMIYGCTKVGNIMADYLNRCGIEVSCFVDRYEAAHGKKYFGHKIIGFEDLISCAVEGSLNLNLIITISDYNNVLLDLYKNNCEGHLKVLVPPKFGAGNNNNNLLLSPLRRRLIKHTDITIISNNCCDMLVYDALGIGARSPFVGSGIRQEDFLKLGYEFDYYISQDLKFEGYAYKDLSLDPQAIYPVGSLGGDIRIYFRHCNKWENAELLWKNQLKKVNKNAMYWIFSDFQEVLKYPIVKEFSSLKINKCISLSKSMYCIPGINYLDVGYGNFLDKLTLIEEWFDLIGWINGEYTF